ncbi:MAG: DNA methyltransferase [Candidatus Bipolaricaulia bacterium]
MKRKQLQLFEIDKKKGDGGFKDPAALENKSLPIHRWVTWIAGFSASFVDGTIAKYLQNPPPNSVVLDPFAGVGTTLIEAFCKGINTIGFEINPFAALASRVKLQSTRIDLEALKQAIASYESYMAPLESQIDRAFIKGYETGDLPGAPEPTTKPPEKFRSRIPFFSPLVEKKILFAFDHIYSLKNPAVQDIFRVALGAVMVGVSNYSYEPSLGSRPAAGKELISNAAVSGVVSNKLWEMAEDIEWFQGELRSLTSLPKAEIYEKSFFLALEHLDPESVDLVITSPPYMNNYHYVRNTRPHLFWLQFVTSPKDLRTLEQESYGKFWQTVRDLEPLNLDFQLPELQEVIDTIRYIKPDKGTYGGSGWANYISTYFNDTYRLMEILKKLLKPKGVAVIVVGNSIIQGVEINVDSFFSKIATLHGISTEGIYIVREKRVGSSIVNTGAREKSPRRLRLYDAAVVLKR